MDRVSMDHDASALATVMRSLDISDRKQEAHEAEFIGHKNSFNDIVGSSDLLPKTDPAEKQTQDELVCKKHVQLTDLLKSMQGSKDKALGAVDAKDQLITEIKKLLDKSTGQWKDDGLFCGEGNTNGAAQLCEILATMTGTVSSDRRSLSG